MPHKQKKASNNHAPNNSSPRADKKQQQQQQQQLQSGPNAPGDSPVLAPTNYREIHQNEVEALHSIYGDDFEEVKNRRSAWHVSVECGSDACVKHGGADRFRISNRPMSASSSTCARRPTRKYISNC